MALSSALTSKAKSNELGVNSMALFPTWYFDESKWLVLASRMQQVEPMTVTKHQYTRKEQALVTHTRNFFRAYRYRSRGGYGYFAIQASLAGASVHAVDVSQAMLTNAQRKAQSWCY